jgi:hypothetical protein
MRKDLPKNIRIFFLVLSWIIVAIVGFLIFLKIIIPLSFTSVLFYIMIPLGIGFWVSYILLTVVFMETANPEILKGSRLANCLRRKRFGYFAWLFLCSILIGFIGGIASFVFLWLIAKVGELINYPTSSFSFLL